MSDLKSETSLAWTPRLATSKKWSRLPADFVTKVQKVFADQFDIEAENGEFIIDGAIYPEEVLVRAGYLESGRLKQVNFEASMDLPIEKEAPSAEDDGSESAVLTTVYTCIDALGGLMEEFFNLGEDEEMDVPFLWKAYKFDGKTVYLQHSTLNTKLEEEADRLLGLLGNKLFDETIMSEDALANADVNTELAQAVQKIIREGKFPHQHVYESERGPDDEEVKN